MINTIHNGYTDAPGISSFFFKCKFLWYLCKQSLSCCLNYKTNFVETGLDLHSASILARE